MLMIDRIPFEANENDMKGKDKYLVSPMINYACVNIDKLPVSKKNAGESTVPVLAR